MQLSEVVLWIGNLSGVASIVVTIILARRASKRKGLSYDVISDASLTGQMAAGEGELKISTGNKEIHNPRSIIIEIRNSGNEAIARVDFDKPITIDFGQATIVQTTVQSRPSDLKPDITDEHTQLIVEPLLLNPGDAFIISTIIDGAGDIEVRGRIVGVKSIKQQPREQARFIGVLPPLTRKTSPGTASLICLLFGPIGAAIYFRSFLDFLLLYGIAIPFFLFIYFVSNTFGHFRMVGG